MNRCPSCQTTLPADYTHCPRDGSALVPVADWAEGSIIRGKYRILAKVGEGGMATVYKAVHIHFKELRALKVISPSLASDASFIRRFEQEAIITRKLQHPNAVRVEDIDEAEDGRPFIVMEYIEGRSLKDVIEREAPMELARVCSIIKQAAAALDAAHALGLVHRDIKPANVALVTSGGEFEPSRDCVKVLDFGIAKLKEAHLEDAQSRQMTLTGTGVLIGTPAYMSPEQAKGLKGAELDGRSDLYSLGIVMYQMLTGELPLKADSTFELLMAHVSTLPKPVQEARPDLGIPTVVAAVAMRCLEKNRELRPASGQALIDDLESAEKSGSRSPEKASATRLVSGPVEVETTSLRVPLSTSASSKSWLWIAVAVLVVGALGSFWYLRKGQTPAAREDRTAATAVSKPKGSSVQSPHPSSDLGIERTKSDAAKPKKSARSAASKTAPHPSGAPSQQDAAASSTSGSAVQASPVNARVSSAPIPASEKSASTSDQNAEIAKDSQELNAQAAKAAADGPLESIPYWIDQSSHLGWSRLTNDTDNTLWRSFAQASQYCSSFHLQGIAGRLPTADELTNEVYRHLLPAGTDPVASAASVGILTSTPGSKKGTHTAVTWYATDPVHGNYLPGPQQRYDQKDSETFPSEFEKIAKLRSEPIMAGSFSGNVVCVTSTPLPTVINRAP